MNEAEYITELEAYRKLCNQMSETLRALTTLHSEKLRDLSDRLKRLEDRLHNA